MICHGQGDPDKPDLWRGGCCIIQGSPCPHRLFIDYTGIDMTGMTEAQRIAATRTAHIFDADGNDLGTVDDYVKQIHNGKPRQDRVVDAMTGSIYVCGVLANQLVADGIPTGANWEADFEAAWTAHYEAGGIAETVGDFWVSLGKPRNWCVTYGMTESECCYGEDQATNDARAARCTTTRVQLATRSTVT